jgi:transposase
MMGKDGEKQSQLLFVDLEELVPEDHLLRKIKLAVDFSFIYELVRPLYSEIGRRSVDPVLLIKMLLVGYLYGISSERKLEQEIKLNLGYRWFLGLDLAERVPDSSTISQNRRRRFKQSELFQRIFDSVVQRCMSAGLVSGEIVVTDSTHIKANAAAHKTETIQVEKPPSQYLIELEKEATRQEEELREKRQPQGKEKRGKKPVLKERRVVSKVCSPTDPDAGLLGRPGKPGGFHYLGHISIDSRHGIITDIHATAGNVTDHEPYLERLKIQREKFGLNIQKVGADKGYDLPEVHHGLEKMQVAGYISSYRRVGHSGVIHKKEFHYDRQADIFICPEGKPLKYSHIYRGGHNKRSKVYASRPKDCKGCGQRKHCFGETAKRRTIVVPLFYEAYERNRVRAQTSEYHVVQRLRRVWCEGTFGTLKQQHNLARTYKRGIAGVQEHCLLAALAMNLKRLVKAVG